MENSEIKTQFVFSQQIFISIRKENPNYYYDIDQKELGKGAFGKVYRGKVAGTVEHWRAIKKIERKAVPNQKMLIEEIQILIALDHPSIIKLYDIFEWKQAVYLVTDFCDGGQLSDKLEEIGTFSQQTARIIFRQIMEGVNYIHQNQIAHRDLKLENLLFLSKDLLSLKLIDFGLAYRWDEDMQSQLRKKGQKKWVGTSYYLSPQVARFQYDQRCDIWSAGVILYMMVSGRPPFDGDTDKEIIYNIRQMQYTMDIPEFENVSKQLKELIQRILVPADERMSIDEIFNHPWMCIDVYTELLASAIDKENIFSEKSLKKMFTNLDIDGNEILQQQEQMEMFDENEVEQQKGKNLGQTVTSCDFNTDDSNYLQ